jgi:hypothetical protein
MGENNGFFPGIRKLIETGHWHVYFIAHASRFKQY